MLLQERSPGAAGARRRPLLLRRRVSPASFFNSVEFKSKGKGAGVAMALAAAERVVGLVALCRCLAATFALKMASSHSQLSKPAHNALRAPHINQIRCPFWRRRATDFFEAKESVLRFLAARHKTLLVYDERTTKVHRRRHRAVQEVTADLARQFHDARYYITGRLDASLYAVDAVFDAPDPDMPVRGTAKFADALSGLFDSRFSSCDLIQIYAETDRQIIALWRLEGVLRLPWRPTIAPFVGETTYTLDAEGLIASHVERWSCTVPEAFISALVSRELSQQWWFLPQRKPEPPPTETLRQDPDVARSLVLRRSI